MVVPGLMTVFGRVKAICSASNRWMISSRIGDDKGQVAKAKLLVDADGTRARPVRRIDKLDITGAKAQAMHGAGGRLVDTNVGSPRRS